MNGIYYTYNNEAIASCVFISVLREIGSIDVARSCLILPFLLDDKTVSYLKDCNVGEEKLSEIIREQRRLFISFNKRYLALLPVSINALLLLNKGGQISIGKKIFDTSNLDFNQVNFGNRFSAIQKAIPNFLILTENLSTVQLYQLLKIEL
ncbi:three component ABC system middle component [Pedobacter gandavensis]|uniref:three component ABC system middle component n=1 Tax=Pedobacter gandavensis TaxID=2679963 RepID=UPI00292CF0CF|nr:three component ABC system middle component [Pedobacter gandavensis]